MPTKPRIPPLPTDEWDPSLRNRRPATSISQSMPGVLNLTKTMAWNPKLCSAFSPFAAAVVDGTLDNRVRELAIIRVAVRTGSVYEWSHHWPIALRLGLTTDEIRRIADGPDAAGWSVDDAAVLRAVDELLDQSTITDATWTALARRFDNSALLSLIFLTGTYRSLATMFNACRTPLDSWVEERPLPPHRVAQG